MFDASRKRLNASLGLRHKLLVSVVWYEDYRSALSSNVNGIHSVKRSKLFPVLERQHKELWYVYS